MGDCITVTIESSEAIAADGNVRIAGASAVLEGSGTIWSATYTVADSGVLEGVWVLVAFEDLAKRRRHSVVCDRRQCGHH